VHLNSRDLERACMQMRAAASTSYMLARASTWSGPFYRETGFQTPERFALCGVRDILSNIHEVPAKESIRQKMLSKMVIAVGDYSALRDLNVGLTNVLQFVRGSINWKRSWGGVKRDFYIPTKAGKDMFIPFFEGSSFVPGDNANSRKKMFSSTSFEVVQNTLGAGNIMPNLLDPYMRVQLIKSDTLFQQQKNALGMQDVELACNPFLMLCNVLRSFIKNEIQHMEHHQQIYHEAFSCSFHLGYGK